MATHQIDIETTPLPAGAPGARTVADKALAQGGLDELNAAFANSPPEELLRWALERWGQRLGLVVAFQIEGVALIDMAWRIDPGIRVITLDTGRLPQETHDLMERIQERYGLEIETYFPRTEALEALVRRQGPNLFYGSLEARHACCQVRKVAPLGRALEGVDAWVTGLRKEQAPSRHDIRVVELDENHRGLAKLNPLADWNTEQVWAYIKHHNVPYSTLYKQGYTSIGCAPCTRPVQIGDDPRSGRWWWENPETKECGLHVKAVTAE